MDNYRFGNANKTTLKKVGGHEAAVFKRMEAVLNAGYSSWAQLDEAVWRLVWEWDCSHVALQASRCCATLIINRSRSPLQIARVQIVVGRNVLLMGSPATGFDADSRWDTVYPLCYPLCCPVNCPVYCPVYCPLYSATHCSLCPPLCCNVMWWILHDDTSSLSPSTPYNHL